jgi:hypothetical protein
MRRASWLLGAAVLVAVTGAAATEALNASARPPHQPQSPSPSALSAEELRELCKHAAQSPPPDRPTGLPSLSTHQGSMATATATLCFIRHR